MASSLEFDPDKSEDFELQEHFDASQLLNTMLLRGKNKPTFAPHVDAGDFVTVINAEQLKFTGKKLVQKDYFHHSQYPGGLKRTPMKKVFDESPGEVIRRAVYGMLPKNRLRNEMMKRLTVNA